MRPPGTPRRRPPPAERKPPKTSHALRPTPRSRSHSWHHHHPPPTPDVRDVGQSFLGTHAGDIGHARRDVRPPRRIATASLRGQHIAQTRVVARGAEVVALEA